jgi:hypothetical protein
MHSFSISIGSNRDSTLLAIELTQYCRDDMKVTFLVLIVVEVC